MVRSGFLSSADRLELLDCVKSQREDHGIARRANALLLLDDGLSCADVGHVLYIDDDTVRSWYKQYHICLLYTSPSPRDKRQSRMPSSA